MKTEEIKSIKIEFEGVEMDTFKSAIKKLDIEAQKAGFSKVADLSGDEIKMIGELNKKINL